jgi:hypothetical protein
MFVILRIIAMTPLVVVVTRPRPLLLSLPATPIKVEDIVILVFTLQ